MLWRPRYDTIVLRDLPCPVAEMTSLVEADILARTTVWFGSFEFDGVIDQGVWWRLFQSDFPNDSRAARVFIFPRHTEQDMSTVRSLVPPSELDRAFLIADSLGVWERTINPPRSDCGFAAVIDGDRIPLAMVGPPTEDAWEAFQTEWATRT